MGDKMIIKVIRSFKMKILQMLGIRYIRFFELYMAAWYVCCGFFFLGLFSVLQYHRMNGFYLVVISLFIIYGLIYIGKKYGKEELPPGTGENTFESPGIRLDADILLDMYKNGVNIHSEKDILTYIKLRMKK